MTPNLRTYSSLEVFISGAISRGCELLRCRLSDVVSPLFRLMFVSFLQALHLGGFSKLWSSIGPAGPGVNTIASRDSDYRGGYSAQQLVGITSHCIIVIETRCRRMGSDHRANQLSVLIDSAFAAEPLVRCQQRVVEGVSLDNLVGGDRPQITDDLSGQWV